MRILSSLLLGLVVASCAVNPFKTAQTAEQRAFAAYGTFVVFEEQAAALVQNPDVPQNVKVSLRDADAIAKPAADNLLGAVKVVLQAKRDLAAGTSTDEKLGIATVHLNEWVTEAVPKIEALVAIVSKAK